MAEFIEREAICYQLAKQATIDGQPRAIRRAAKIVADFPPADVQPVRHGRWINHGWSTVCSECGEDYAFAKRNYCPNCGAVMMDGKENKKC